MSIMMTKFGIRKTHKSVAKDENSLYACLEPKSSCCNTSFIAFVENSSLKNAVSCFGKKRELEYYVVKSPELVLLIDNSF